MAEPTASEGKKASSCSPIEATKPKASSCSPIEGKEAKVCRFCFEGGEAQRLISPCACRGGSKYVHFDCAKRFYESRRLWSDLKCPTCQHPYDSRTAALLGEHGLRETENEFGLEAEEVAIMLNHLAIVYGEAGRGAEQKTLLERALRILERAHGAQHVRVGSTLHNLGSAHLNLGEFDRALDLFERALVIGEREYGPTDPRVAAVLNGLGVTYTTSDQHAKARDVLERALAIRTREYGPLHTNNRRTVYNLANAYFSLGDFAKARTLCDRALLIAQREFGDGHAEAAGPLALGGRAALELGEAARAVELLGKALGIMRQPGWADSGSRFVVLATKEHLAKAHSKHGDHRKACDLLEVALKQREREYGENTPETARVRADYARALHANGRARLAVKAMERALPHLDRRTRRRSDAREAAAQLAAWRGDVRSRSPRR